MPLTLAPNPAPNSAQIKTQLEEILASEWFSRSPRMRRFLAYIVEETLAGRASQICEYGVGLAVFDRDESFEPQIDTIVRNDARRLRSKLLEYYRQTPMHSVTIEIPKGGYVPVFTSSFRHAELATQQRIAVSKLETCSQAGDALFAFAQTLGLSLTSGLTHQAGLEVIAHLPTPTQHQPTLLLQGAIASQNELCRALLCLIRLPGAVQVWSGEYEVNPEDFLGSEYAIVSQVLREIAPILHSDQSVSHRLVLVA